MVGFVSPPTLPTSDHGGFQPALPLPLPLPLKSVASSGAIFCERKDLRT